VKHLFNPNCNKNKIEAVILYLSKRRRQSQCHVDEAKMSEEPAKEREIGDGLVELFSSMKELEEEFLSLSEGRGTVRPLLDKCDSLANQCLGRFRDWENRAGVTHPWSLSQVAKDAAVFSAGNVGQNLWDQYRSTRREVLEFCRTLIAFLNPELADTAPTQLELIAWQERWYTRLHDVEYVGRRLIEWRETLDTSHDPRMLSVFVFQDKRLGLNSGLRDVLHEIGLLGPEISTEITAADIEYGGVNLLLVLLDFETRISKEKKSFKRRAQISNEETTKRGLRRVRSEEETDRELCEKCGAEPSLEPLRDYCSEVKEKLVQAFGRHLGRGMHH
jgi:hypothetical protein